MRKIVVTLNVGRNVIPDNGRASMREAARRWGADFLEILVPTGERGTYTHHYYQKLRLHDHLPDNCRVVFFDGDVVVRGDCPSLFDIVPAGHVGWSRFNHPSHSGAMHNVYQPMGDFLRSVSVEMDLDEEYPNTGVIVFDLPANRAMFEEAEKLVVAHGFHGRWEIADQGYLSASAKRTNQPVFYLPPMFNMCGDYLWTGWEPTMKLPVYHFCGPIDRENGIRRTNWDDVGPDKKVAGTGITRWVFGKPVHLTGGDELPYFLRELARIRRGRIVEVGCYLGGATWWGANIARDNYCEYVAVDHWRGAADLGVDENIYRGFLANMKDSALDDFVRIVRKPSVAAAAEFGDESVDLVFIDADHTLEGCAADIDAYWRTLKVGGVMLGHDYCPPYGVMQAVQKRFGRPDEVSAGAYPIWKVTKR